MKTKPSKPTKPSESERGNIAVNRNSITIKFSAADKRKAANCLEKSGKITFSLKPHSVTKLPQILDNGVSVD
jgi:hypothetical protein